MISSKATAFPLLSPPDYDAPSPSADDHMELELPDEHGDGSRTSNIIEVNQPVTEGAPAANASAAPTRTEDIPRPPTPANGDLNSRLDSMMGSNAIPGLSDPRDFDLRGTRPSSSKSQGPAATSSSSNYSISEFLTKLASGEDVDVEEFTKGSSRGVRGGGGGGGGEAVASGATSSSSGGGENFWGRDQDLRPVDWRRQTSRQHSQGSSAIAQEVSCRKRLVNVRVVR